MCHAGPQPGRQGSPASCPQVTSVIPHAPHSHLQLLLVHPENVLQADKAAACWAGKTPATLSTRMLSVGPKTDQEEPPARAGHPRPMQTCPRPSWTAAALAANNRMPQHPELAVTITSTVLQPEQKELRHPSCHHEDVRHQGPAAGLTSQPGLKTGELLRSWSPPAACRAAAPESVR